MRRTYHTTYLWRNDINSYFQTIINKVNIYSTDNIYLKSVEQLNEEIKEIKIKKVILVKQGNYEIAAEFRYRELLLLKTVEYKS